MNETYLKSITESYEARITNRLDDLLAVTGEIAVSTESYYEHSPESAAHNAISALRLIEREFESIIGEMIAMGNVLLSSNSAAITGAKNGI